MRLETPIEDLKTASALCIKCLVCTYGKWPDNYPLCAIYEKHRVYNASPGGMIYLVKALSEKWAGYSPGMSEVAYQCTLCGNCDLCEIIPVPAPHVTPSDLVRFLRHSLVKEGLAPEAIRKLQDRVKRDGSRAVRKAELQTAGKVTSRSPVLFFEPTRSKTEERIYRSAISLFEKMKTPLAVFDSGARPGAQLYDLGLWDELKASVEKNDRDVKKLTGRRIIFLNPHTQEFVTRKYSDISPSQTRLKGKHMSEVLRDAFKKGSLKPANGKKVKVSYHDPCRLSRGLGITEAPRKVLEAVGAQVVEMKRNREDTYCCGAGAINPTFGAFSKKVAMERLAEFKETGADTLVTACPHCNEVFSSLLGKERSRVKDLVEFVDERT